jgi:hypothetical protein
VVENQRGVAPAVQGQAGAGHQPVDELRALEAGISGT